MSKVRYTIETIASGQPRPYADSRTHVRVTIEQVQTWKGENVWKPWPRSKKGMEEALKRLACGWVEHKENRHGLEAHTKWLKPVMGFESDGKTPIYGDPEKDTSGTWEFYTVIPFCD